MTPLAELAGRMRRFRARMDVESPDWQLATILGRINQYYLTGTMQDAVLLVRRDEEPTLWVRRSFERARSETPFPDIRPMKSFHDVAQPWVGTREVIHVEAEVVRGPTSLGMGLACRWTSRHASPRASTSHS